jgi:hypothetical protein
MVAMMSVVQEAVEKVGGSDAAARKLRQLGCEGVTTSHVKEWVRLGTMSRAPYECVVRLSEMSEVPIEDLAPLDD